MSALLGPPTHGPAPNTTFEEFHDRHRDERDEARRRLRYVMDFYRSKEYVMKHNGMNAKHRVLEAMKLTAWANFRDYPADEKGRPLSQTDIAQLTGLPTQRVSELYDELEADHLIRTQGRIPFLIDDPELEADRRTKGKPFPPPSGKPDIEAEALAYWKEQHPDRFQEYQKIDQEFREKAAERKRLRDEAVENYRAFQAAKESEGAEDARPISTPVRETRKSRTGRENAPERAGKRSGASLFGSKAVKELASYEQQIREALAQSGLSGLSGNLAKAVRIAASKLADAPIAQREAALDHYAGDLRQLAARRENKPKSWGIVASAMDDAIKFIATAPMKARSAPQPVPETEPPSEEQIEGLLEMSPAHPQAADWREQLRKLRQPKAADSERKAKAKKAGHA